MDFWEWLGDSIERDPAGWIAVALVVIASAAAPWWWGPLKRRLGSWRARRQEERAAHAGVSRTGRQPIRSEVYVSFESTSSKKSEYTAYGSGTLQGGTLTYTIGNHGPLDAQDVRLELVGPEIEAKTPIYWKSLAVAETGTFTVHIPFAKDRDVILHWRHNRRPFSRHLTLPTE